MVALATVPIAALVRLLTLPHLYAVASVAGTAGAAYSVAQSSFLPTLVGREHLVEANAKFQTSRTIAQLAARGSPAGGNADRSLDPDAGGCSLGTGGPSGTS